MSTTADDDHIVLRFRLRVAARHAANLRSLNAFLIRVKASSGSWT